MNIYIESLRIPIKIRMGQCGGWRFRHASQIRVTLPCRFPSPGPIGPIGPLSHRPGCHHRRGDPRDRRGGLCLELSRRRSRFAGHAVVSAAHGGADGPPGACRGGDSGGGRLGHHAGRPDRPRRSGRQGGRAAGRRRTDPDPGPCGPSPHARRLSHRYRRGDEPGSRPCRCGCVLAAAEVHEHRQAARSERDRRRGGAPEGTHRGGVHDSPAPRSRERARRASGRDADLRRPRRGGRAKADAPVLTWDGRPDDRRAGSVAGAVIRAHDRNDCARRDEGGRRRRCPC